MKIERFEDIIAWQKAKIMALQINSTFKNSNDFAFKDQICRSSISVMNNIAEGFERQTDNEFKRYLFIAKGSCGEVRPMIHLAENLKYINIEEQKTLLNLSLEISKLLSGLIKSLSWH